MAIDLPENIDLYYYRAVISDNNYDGDTITVDIDLGMNQWRVDVDIRPYDVDTPEIRARKSLFPTEEERQEEMRLAREARDIVQRWLPLGKQVILRTYKDEDGKFGRPLAEVYFEHEGQWVSLAEILKEEGYDKNSDNYRGS